MKRNRTCKQCQRLQPVELLSHKGNAVFMCKNTEECLAHSLDNSKTNVNKYSGKSFVVTSIVEGVPIDLKALRALEFYCKETSSQLVIMTVTYKQLVEDSQALLNYEWDRIADYILTDEVVVGGKVRLIGNIQISPTAVNPLSGLEPITRGLSSIVPSSQLALKSIANIPTERAIFLYSTGCISEPYYSDSKAGFKAQFHHSKSAIKVELDESNEFYIRTLPITKEGHVYDFSEAYTPNETFYSLDYTLVRGDTHVGCQSYSDDAAITKLIVEQGSPQYLVLHDVFDGSSINHHELDNPFTNNDAFSTLESEFEAVTDYLSNWSDYSKIVIADSNHHDFLTKWVQKVDWKKLKGTGNQATYLRLAQLLSDINENGGSILQELLGDFDGNVRYLNKDESFRVGNVELSMHGHLGANGARGGSNSFNHIGLKTVTGHTHSASINKSHYCCGTSTNLRLGYTKGLSSWSNTHVIVFNDGKRQMFTTFNSKYRA